MVRLKTKWNRKDRARECGETGSALAMSVWKLASQSLLNLENEGFETRTNAQRLDAIAELLAYSLHLIDRLAHVRLDEERRRRLIGAVAARVAEIMRDNRADIGESGSRVGFVDLVNRRGDEYSDCSFDADEGPSFTMRRILGQHVQRVLGDKDNRWIPDYVLDAEAPEIYKGIKRVARSLL